MHQLPSYCPICKSNLEVTRVYCARCDTTIEGHFAPSANPFAVLNQEQMHFLMTFIRCEGRFNRMADELDISYPTLRNRFQEILTILGFESKEDDTPKLNPQERMKILDQLANSEISAEEAQLLLSGSSKAE